MATGTQDTICEFDSSISEIDDCAALLRSNPHPFCGVIVVVEIAKDTIW